MLRPDQVETRNHLMLSQMDDFYSELIYRCMHSDRRIKIYDRPVHEKDAQLIVTVATIHHATEVLLKLGFGGKIHATT